MARLSLSFLSVLLVLAAFALSIPVKRDGIAPGLGLDSTLGPLKVKRSFMHVLIAEVLTIQSRVPPSLCLALTATSPSCPPRSRRRRIRRRKSSKRRMTPRRSQRLIRRSLRLTGISSLLLLLPTRSSCLLATSLLPLLLPPTSPSLSPMG